MDLKKESQGSRLLDFTARTFVVALAVYLVISALFADVYRAIDKVDGMLNVANSQLARVEGYLSRASNSGNVNGNDSSDPVKRLVGPILSELTSNPEIHYQNAVAKADTGDLAGAVQEIDLAIGLVSPDKQKYESKLKEWQSRLTAQKP